jgi:SAM-dependent methyltransferase
MTIAERILLTFSKRPGDNDYQLKDSAITIDTALDPLHREYPNFADLVSKKRVVDYGCGIGYQSIALVKKYECSVIGIDTNQTTLKKAINNAKDHNILPQRLSFVERISPSMLNSFDVVISKDSFEHFGNPDQALNQMSSLLNEFGILLLTFGPPWFSPYGSHMNFFCKVPWINILFSEKTVMKVRSNYRNDGAAKYEEVESGLNKMTIAKFENIVSSNNMQLKTRNYKCIKGTNWLSKLPTFRELFIYRVTAVFSKAT